MVTQLIKRILMKYLILTFTGLALTAANGAVTIAADNFYSLGAGVNMDASTDWQAKWDVAQTTQRNLYKGDGAGGVTLDTTVAFLNYHALHQTGFTVDATQPKATVSLTMTYTHEAGGNATVVNKALFGPMISTTANWWDGANDTFSLSNRGGVIGNTVAGAPFIESWNPHSALGINTTTGGTSVPITIAWDLTSNGATIDAQATYSYGSTSFTSTKVDTGVAIGTTIYGGFSTAWNDQGNTTALSSFSKISSVGVDDFSIVAVPEPSSVALSALSALGLLKRRR